MKRLRFPAAVVSALALIFAIAWSQRPLWTSEVGAGVSVDLSTVAKRLAWSDDVSVARVIAKRGTFVEDIPRTLWLVEVEEAIKGNLSGRVVVSQLGGPTWWGFVETLVEDDDPLETGGTYLFSTRGSRPRSVPAYTHGWHSIAGPGGHVPVDDPEVRRKLVATYRAGSR